MLLLDQSDGGVHKFGDCSDHCGHCDPFDHFDSFGDFDHFCHLIILKMPRILLVGLVQPVLLLDG